MLSAPESDNAVYCWLRRSLEPRFQVCCEPAAAYYSEQLFRYVIRDGDHVIGQLHGDFRLLKSGQLIADAEQLVRSLLPAAQVQPGLLPAAGLSGDFTTNAANHGSGWTFDGQPVIASKLSPLQSTESRTYFSSGRAAFAFLMKHVLRPRRLWLPTYCCWSLISVAQQQCPEIELMFYVVDRLLCCSYPSELESGDAIVFIHYFGHGNATPPVSKDSWVLEDQSHLLIPGPVCSGCYGFGSLRKTFRIADGGYVNGRYDPTYDADSHQPGWLRRKARDWRDLREAENMQDREFRMSDMSSQSVVAMQGFDVVTAAVKRRSNERFLTAHFPVGAPLTCFLSDEVPLLHNRILPSQQARDSLRSFMAARGIFCSIHWPLHPLLEGRQHEVDISAARWLEQHVLSIPVSDEFDEHQMARICEVAEEWRHKGLHGNKFDNDSSQGSKAPLT